MNQPTPARVVTLDLIRGFALLGILTINIAGFAGPTGATLSPDLPAPGSAADAVVFAISMVLFEGKMRALFTILFGASMLLFIERAEATGRDGDVLQLRRLGWLLLFGLLHFFLLWWGDILTSFALVGIIALFMRELPTRTMLTAALLIFAGWHLGSAAMNLPEVQAEQRVEHGTATAAEVRSETEFRQRILRKAQHEMIEYRSGFIEQIAIKFHERPLWLIKTTVPNVGETLPLMLIGMALYRSGFFGGEWDRRRLRRLAMLGTASGLALTLPIVGWLWAEHFPPRAMTAALLYWLAVPHLLMAAGYAALLVRFAPRLLKSGLGQRIAAAGRMAFSNYIGTSIAMTTIFYGWGLGLIGKVDRVEQIAFVLLGWALMLGWSKPWLARFRHGPLEWLWRSLIEGRRAALIK